MRWLLRSVRRFFESLWLPLVAAVAVAVLTFHVFRADRGWPLRHETAFHVLLAAPPLLMLVSLVFLCFAKRWGRAAGATGLCMVFVLFSGCVFLGISFRSIFEGPGPPRSIDLPLDRGRDRAVRAFLEQSHERDWDQWDVGIVTYVQRPDRQSVEVSYFYETAGASGSKDHEFLFADGRLAPQYWFTRNEPVVPPIESPLEWPVLVEVDRALRNEVARLSAPYSEALRQELAYEGELAVEIEQIRYSARFKDDRWAGITAILSARGEQIPWLRPRLDFDYEDGRFRLWKIHGGGSVWTRGTAALAGLNALDRAVRQWLATAEPDAPLGPSPYLETEFSWREVAGDLPGSAGRLVLERRCAHALFADFDYRLRAELPGRPARTFVLPFGDNRTCISVFFAERDGRRLLYLQQTCGTGISIDVDALRFTTFEPSSADLIGAFLGVTTGFEYVDVLADRAGARRLFRAAADRGETYSTPLEALHALEATEAAQRDPAASP